MDKNNDGSVNSDFTQLTTDDLPKGEVLIKVHYSGINYKDALATTDNNQILKSYPMVPGIDLLVPLLNQKIQQLMKVKKS